MNKILVVDDDRIIGEMLEFMLDSNGYLVVVSNKPEQTVQNILQEGINLVMLDYFIFGSSGIEICRELKCNKNTSLIPVIMMSGQSTVEKECLTAGAIYFIFKPFEMQTLLSKN